MLDLLLDNNFLSSIIAFAIILIPAIIIHELGHFIAAKMVGISVLEFGVGFPPRAVRLFWWGETEFTLNWLPIGGFVRPLGEDMMGPVLEEEPEYDEGDYDGEDKPKNISYISEREELMARGVPEDKLQSVNETKPWSRIWFMVAGAVFNVVSAVIFFIIAALIGIPIEQGARVQITSIPENSVFNQSQVFVGDAVELVNGEYFANHVAFFETLSAASGDSVEITMRHPDNFDDEDLAGTQYLITVTPNVDSITPYVIITAVVENSPAEAAGLLPGDLVTAINGEPLSIENPIGDMIAATDESLGVPMQLSVIRDGESFSLSLTPRENPPPNEGRMGVGIAAQWQTNDGVYFQNANPQVELIPQSFGDSVAYGFNRTGTVLKLIAELPGQLISGAISPEQARPVSIVGISQIGGMFLQESIRTGSPAMVLDFIALISIFLGITNLLPFPPLDGGRILFVLIEIIRGKPVSPKIENAVNRVGIILLLGLGVIVIIFDIINPINLG